ncbi:hypothetical protein [Clostridium hydrogenum]|nr:hypothetical protein [Clostridium hydrogenum]
MFFFIEKIFNLLDVILLLIFDNFVVKYNYDVKKAQSKIYSIGL